MVTQHPAPCTLHQEELLPPQAPCSLPIPGGLLSCSCIVGEPRQVGYPQQQRREPIDTFISLRALPSLGKSLQQAKPPQGV